MHRPTRKRRVVLAALGIQLSLLACGPSAHTTRRRLPSGMEIDLVSTSLHGDAWHFEYCTQLPLSPHEPVACEAKAVWEGVEPEATSSGAEKAYIFAMRCKREVAFMGWRPVVLSAKATAFRLFKDDHGSWHQSGGWSGTSCEN